MPCFHTLGLWQAVRWCSDAHCVSINTRGNWWWCDATSTTLTFPSATSGEVTDVLNSLCMHVWCPSTTLRIHVTPGIPPRYPAAIPLYHSIPKSTLLYNPYISILVVSPQLVIVHTYVMSIINTVSLLGTVHCPPYLVWWLDSQCVRTSHYEPSNNNWALWYTKSMPSMYLCCRWMGI